MNAAELEGQEKKVTKGTLVFGENQQISELTVIVEGKLVSVSKTGRMEFKKGSVIGLVEGLSGKTTANYFADEDTVMMVYPYGNMADNIAVSMAKTVNPGNMIAAAICQVNMILDNATAEDERTKKFFAFVKEEYKRYTELCKGYNAECRTSARIDSLMEFIQQTKLDEDKMEYMKQLMKIPENVRTAFFDSSIYMVRRHLIDIMMAAQSVVKLYGEINSYLSENSLALIADDSDNLFSMYEDLILQLASKKGKVSTLLKKADEILNYANAFENIDKKVIQKVKDDYQDKLQMMNVNSDNETEFSNENQQPAKESAPAGGYTSAQLEIIRKITQNTTEKILAYAGMEEAKNEKLRQQLTVFAGIDDKRSNTDEAGSVRRSLTALYYDLYEAVIKKYVKEEKPIPLLEMFLTFGLLDEHLVNDVALADLFYTKRDEDMGGYQIYNMKEWLFKIYRGEHEPSRNEFDLDYDGTFRDMKKTQKFTKEQEEAYKKDQVGKMVFELRNMLTSTNKMTNGQIMSFCPILFTDGNESLKPMLTQKSAVRKTFDSLLRLDYSCFYREITFWDTEHGVNKEFIQKEVKPIIILMPNIGAKGAMWQELSGPRKDTPARFALPLLCKENLSKLAVAMMGQYRWEICRNIQGVYWNDLSEKSLTSEYFDYAQFYKKNHDLSQQAKDKIKQNLTKAKNSFRGMFVQDYSEWVLLESKGSQRLNKVVREILTEYIPFPKEIREELKKNPTYSGNIEKFERHTAEKVKKATNIETTIIKHKGKVTEDLEKYLEFLKM
ncbi:MAG: hypothetical protein K2M46_14615 [Lachnospiraceae bacterium]|nr:hypothetical protein [Lachnospiraceae bacterium]